MRRAFLTPLALLLVLPAQAAVHGNFAAPAATAAAATPSPSAPLNSPPLVGRTTGTGRTMASPTLPRTTSIGAATVFVRAQQLTPEVAAHLREMRKVPRLTSSFYLADDAAANGRLALDNQKFTLQGLDFTLDPGNQLAARNGVSPGTIVFRDGLGAIRHYDLLKEYPTFAAEVHFIGGGR